MPNLKERLSNTIADKKMQAESAAIAQFYEKVAKEDGISYSEAVYLCQTEPKYMLGVKMQRYMVRAVSDPRHAAKHREEMLSTLSPEEMEIYENEVQGINMTKLVKQAVKEKVKGKR